MALSATIAAKGVILLYDRDRILGLGRIGLAIDHPLDGICCSTPLSRSHKRAMGYELQCRSQVAGFFVNDLTREELDAIADHHICAGYPRAGAGVDG